MTTDLSNNVQLAVMLGRLAPKERQYKVAADASEIIKSARSLAALSVADCNYGLTKRQETRRQNLAKRVNALAAEYGLEAGCYGDPRGYVVRLHGKDVVQNGFGEGFGVA